MRSYVVISGVVFDVVAAVQILRLVYRWPVTIAGIAVPLWVSGVAAFIAATLAIWAVRLVFRTRVVQAPA